jgi:hypothetical protein
MDGTLAQLCNHIFEKEMEILQLRETNEKLEKQIESFVQRIKELEGKEGAKK